MNDGGWYSLIVEWWWNIILFSNCLLGLQNFKTLFIICFVLLVVCLSSQHMPCIVAMGDCTHVQYTMLYASAPAMHCCYGWLYHVQYTMLYPSAHAMHCCYGWLYPCAVCNVIHISTSHTLLLWVTVPMCSMQCYTHQHLPHIVAMGDCTHIVSATDAFKVLVTVAQENSSSLAVYVLVLGRGLLKPPGLGKHFPMYSSGALI